VWPTGLILSILVLVILAISRLYRPVLDTRFVAPARGHGLLLSALAVVVFLCGLGAEWAFSGPLPGVMDAAAQYGANPPLPAPHEYLLPPMRVAPNVPWSQDTPIVPAGLKIQALAQGLSSPRSLFVLPNGDVLVVESGGPQPPLNRPKDAIMHWIEAFIGSRSPAPNRITLLRDTKGTGVADMRTVFLDHLHSPFGVALVGHDLYVADTDAILHTTYTDGQTTITDPPTKLAPLPGGPIDHHWTKSLVASPDGTKLYVGVGSNSNIMENGLAAELNRADILEVDRATGAYRVFASGLRNPNGLQFEPTSGKLWAVVNERDELGPNLVPDYLTSVKDGAFYGWPYSYYGQHVDPRVEPQRPDLVARAIAPDYALSSHVAPLGMVFYTANNLPAAYHGGAFVGEHGSWDRTPLNGYQVIYIPFTNGAPSGPPQYVVTGFLNAQKQARGRPVGLAIDHTGALLIADDLGGTVWRVSAK
jgi:glucose/arabinose dehydrogenase